MSYHGTWYVLQGTISTYGNIYTRVYNNNTLVYILPAGMYIISPTSLLVDRILPRYQMCTTIVLRSQDRIIFLLLRY